MSYIGFVCIVNIPFEKTLMVQIFYPNTDYKVREEYIAYDFSSLTADFGGYLGLLLGHSILTLYDVGLDLFEKLAAKTNKRKV